MATTTHILNGDALAEQVLASGLSDPFISWREAMVEGPVSSESAEHLFSVRASYLNQRYPDPDRTYQSHVLPEMERVMSLPVGTSVYLWFEDDLFCQVNMWSVLWLLSHRNDLAFYRVFPAETSPEYRWMGFGANKPEDLPGAMELAVLMSREEETLGVDLWKAFVSQNLDELTRLSISDFEAFRDLEEVVNAWKDHPHRIQATIQQLLDEGVTEFAPVFRTVWKEHGIYGFGDLQIKEIFDRMIS